jgi:hypothetical protein
MPEPEWVGHRLDDAGGAKVGRIVGLIAGQGAEPGWLQTKIGRLGHVTAVPAADAVEGAGCVWVPYGRDVIRSAPRVAQHGELKPEAERELRRHYDVG